MAGQLGGAAAFTVYIAAQIRLFDVVRPVGGRGLVFLLTFVTTSLFWWLSAIHAGVPPDPAPAFASGRGRYRSVPHRSRHRVVVHVLRPDHVGHQSYGSAGVVIAVMTFVVGFGVCLHAGAVFGRMWTHWQDERAVRP